MIPKASKFARTAVPISPMYFPDAIPRSLRNARKAISKKWPSAEIEGNPKRPRRGAFEITVDDALVFSKLTSKRFPNEGELVNNIQTLLETGKAPTLEVGEDSFCTLF
ncbi:Rdx [Balamuthia mandrillaris]